MSSNMFSLNQVSSLESQFPCCGRELEIERDQRIAIDHIRRCSHCNKEFIFEELLDKVKSVTEKEKAVILIPYNEVYEPAPFEDLYNEQDTRHFI